MSQPSPKPKPTDRGEEFVQLLLQHEPQVRSFLRGLLPTWDDVDDVLQESGMIAWRKFSEFEQGTAFGGWFLTIARYEALAHRRRIAKTPLSFSEDVLNILADDALQEDVAPLNRIRLEACLAKLDSQKRKLLIQAHTPVVVMRDLAAESGRSEQAFYKAIQRLRAVIVDCVSKSVAAESA